MARVVERAILQPLAPPCDAVEVDVFFVDAPVPGKAVGIEGVDQDELQPGRPVRIAGRFEPTDLGTRARVALDAVRARNNEQARLGVVATEDRDIDREVFALRPFGVRIEIRSVDEAARGGGF